MNKLRVLGIAPYEGIRTLMLQVAKHREYIELTAYVGDLNEGLKIASKYTSNDFDVIISRGGTAELIQEKCPIPVVEINISPMDILRSIQLAHNMSNKYALVGFPSITKSAYLLCDLLQYNIEIYTIHNKSDAENILAELMQKGVNMILCDMVTYSLAQTMGMTAILITSGLESVENAFDEAIKVRDRYKSLNSYIEFFKTLLEDNPYTVCVYNKDFEQIYSIKYDLVPDTIKKKIQEKTPLVFKEKSLKMYKEVHDTLYDISAVYRSINGKDYAIFYINSSKACPSMLKGGIQYLNRDDVISELFESFYGIIQPILFPDSFIKKYTDCSYPVMIIGEEGTGKEQLAYTLYTKSRLSNHPFVIINCFLFTPEDLLLLNENPATIYFKNIGQIPQQRFEELFSLIKDLKIYEKNKLIFTFYSGASESIQKRYNMIINHFSCVTIQVPPLRDQVDLIPDLSGIYISKLNLSMAKNILGFEADALSVMKSYDWPGNYNQFKRIINQLVLSTDTSYIKASAVTKLLENEVYHSTTNSDPANAILISKDKTLEEFNYDIIMQVLAEEKGNQSSAAKRLGISRTTLWRILQKKTAADR